MTKIAKFRVLPRKSFAVFAFLIQQSVKFLRKLVQCRQLSISGTVDGLCFFVCFDLGLVLPIKHW